ncbi:fimbrial protein [Pseudomonas graminis]
MQKKPEIMDLFRLSPPERYSRLILAAAVMIAPLVIGGIFSLITLAHAADNWNVEGANGVLRVHGALTESACRLKMESAWQDIPLGETGTGRLRKVGDRGTSHAVRLMLEDCLPATTRSQDSRTGNLLWSDSQPTVSVSFMAPLDEDNPQLVKVQGAGGLALQLTDAQGRKVRLDGQGSPLLLTPGQNELTYIVTPERTKAPLQAGAWWAQLNFGMSYE